MIDRAPRIRLHISSDLTEGAEIALDRAQANYLFNVMRLTHGAQVLVFNGAAGEFVAEVTQAGKKGGTLTVTAQTRAPVPLPDIHLLFAPVKKARTDFIVEKACELGCGVIRPVFTRFTNSERLNPERLYAHMVEAAEQCGGLNVPELREAERLDAVLARWPEDRVLIFCDVRGGAPLIGAALTDLPRGTAAAVLIGPEGGFAPEEAERLHALPQTRAVSLGPRILRADTAVVAALALVQSTIGDW